jgi:hypothetical protein
MTGDGDELSRWNGEIDRLQNLYFMTAAVQGFNQSGYFYQKLGKV